jgi:hypothetical protein
VQVSIVEFDGGRRRVGFDVVKRLSRIEGFKDSQIKHFNECMKYFEKMLPKMKKKTATGYFSIQ